MYMYLALPFLSRLRCALAADQQVQASTSKQPFSKQKQPLAGKAEAAAEKAQAAFERTLSRLRWASDSVTPMQRP